MSLAATLSTNRRAWDEIRALVRLALPIVLSQVGFVLMGFVDTVMAGRAGAQEQAVVGLGVALWIPVLVALIGVVQAVSPLVARHFGAGNKRGVVDDSREGVWLGAACGLAPLPLMPLVPALLAAMQIPPELAARTESFLWGVMLGMPAVLMFRALGFYSASINHPRPIMVLAFVGLGSNAALNWLLIYGHWGLPALGGAGCGWATGIGQWLALTLMVLYTRYSPHYRDYPLWHGWRRPSWAAQRRLLRLGLPMGAAHLAEVAAFTGVALLVGRFGAAQIAAHQVAINFASIVFMLPMGLATALGIRVGHALGGGDRAGARRIAWTGMALALAVGLALAPLLLVSREAIVALYTPDLEVRELAVTLMLFAVVWQLADAAQVTAVGALRGYHVTIAPMWMMLVAFWLVAIPLGVLLGYHGVPALGIAPLKVFGFWTGLLIGLGLVGVGTSWALYVVSGRR